MEEIDLKEVSDILAIRIIDIGNIIRKKRIQAGITQQTLAFYILNDKGMISNIERGACNNITIYTLIKIAKVLDMDIKELIT